MTDLTVREMIERKRACEETIAAAVEQHIAEFERATGVRIDSVYLGAGPTPLGIGEPRQRYAVQLKLDLFKFFE